MAHAFPEVIEALGAVPGDVVVDAELVLADEQGRSDFEELRRRALLQRSHLIDMAARRTPASLVVFDVLFGRRREPPHASLVRAEGVADTAHHAYCSRASRRLPANVRRGAIRCDDRARLRGNRCEAVRCAPGGPSANVAEDQKSTLLPARSIAVERVARGYVSRELSSCS